MLEPIIPARRAFEDPTIIPSIAGATFAPIRTLLIGMSGEPLVTDEEFKLWDTVAGGRKPLDEPADEIDLIAGRRSSKTLGAASWGCYRAACFDYSSVMAPGEEIVIPFMATTTRTARVAFSYAKAIFEMSEVLSPMVVDIKAESIILNNGVALEIRPASFRHLRGLSLGAAILDEGCYLYLEDSNSRNSDEEISAAIRPGLSSTAGPFLKSSSPYAQSGEMFKNHSKYFGKDGAPVLVFQAPSRTLNPTLKQSIIDRAIASDPSKAQAEYLAEFRKDVTGFCDQDMADRITPKGIKSLPPMDGIDYTAFADFSGGRKDSSTIGIAFRCPETKKVKLAQSIEVRAPHDPEFACQTFVDLAKEYGCKEIVADNYSAGWAANAVRSKGIGFRVSKRNKSDIYLSLLPSIAAEQISLLDNDRLISQLVSLERRTSQAGRDRVDHVKNGHDDVINSAAGAIVEITNTRHKRRKSGVPGFGTFNSRGDVDIVRPIEPKAESDIKPGALDEALADLEQLHEKGLL